MDVSPLLSKGVELVEEQDAAAGFHIVKELAQSRRRLAQVTADETLVANDDKRNHQGVPKGLGQRGLAVTRRASEKDSMPGSEVIRTKQVGAMMLVNQFSASLLHSVGENQFFKRSLRDDFVKEFRNGPIGGRHRPTRGTWKAPISAELFGEAAGKDGVLPRAVSSAISASTVLRKSG